MAGCFEQMRTGAFLVSAKCSRPVFCRLNAGCRPVDVSGMSKPISFFLVLATVLVSALSWAVEPPLLSFAVVPQLSTRQIHRVWQPLLAEVGREAGVRFRLRVPKDIPAFARGLYRQEFDLAYANPAQYAEVSAHYLPLVRDHGRQLQGVLVARAGAVKDVVSLSGKRVAFPDHAYAASVLLQRELRRLGLSFVPVYVPNHASVYLGVAVGLYAAGGGVAATLSRQAEGVRRALQVVYRTTPSPPHPLIVHRRVAPEVRERIRRAFLSVFDRRPDLFAEVPMEQLGVAGPEEYRQLTGASP